MTKSKLIKELNQVLSTKEKVGSLVYQKKLTDSSFEREECFLCKQKFLEETKDGIEKNFPYKAALEKLGGKFDQQKTKFEETLCQHSYWEVCKAIQAKCQELELLKDAKIDSKQAQKILVEMQVLQSQIQKQGKSWKSDLINKLDDFASLEKELKEQT